MTAVTIEVLAAQELTRLADIKKNARRTRLDEEVIAVLISKPSALSKTFWDDFFRLATAALEQAAADNHSGEYEKILISFRDYAPYHIKRLTKAHASPNQLMQSTHLDYDKFHARMLLYQLRLLDLKPSFWEEAAQKAITDLKASGKVCAMLRRLQEVLG